MTSPAESPAVFGYLSVMEDASHRFTGGYLAVTPSGRPLEFHCTEPVVTSRAQEILFGPTLKQFVASEQIGGSLLRKAKLKPSLVLVRSRDAFATPTPSPLALVGNNDIEEIRSQRLALPELSDLHAWAASPEQGDLVVQRLMQLAVAVDVLEPFERIEEAIREAQRLASPMDDEAGEGATRYAA